jgi:antitoxin (DNA-binding transcriptional repressor) of toxin-antitoxin stability system
LICHRNDIIKTGIMTTLTVTAARQKLGYWLKRAARGEEIGIVCGASLFPLRKAPIEAGDYMEQEYGLTKEQADRAAARLLANSRRGKYIPLEQLAARVAARRKAKSRAHARRAA